MVLCLKVILFVEGVVAWSGGSWQYDIFVGVGPVVMDQELN